MTEYQHNRLALETAFAQFKSKEAKEAINKLIYLLILDQHYVMYGED